MSHAFGFITDQTGRGLQLEAPVSALLPLARRRGIPGSFIYYDRDLLTFQVDGPGGRCRRSRVHDAAPDRGCRRASRRSGAYKAWRGASFVRLFPPLALALVLALIVFNKVGSPQFLTWLIAPLVALARDRPTRWVRPAALRPGHRRRSRRSSTR